MGSETKFFIYLVGFLIVVGGLAWGAHLAGIAPVWIGVGVVVLIGFGILSAVKKTQTPSASDGGRSG